MSYRYYIEASVHKKLENGAYRVKVDILNEDILMYINGTRVFPPKEDKSWSVQTPSFGKGKTIEFDGKSPLWKEYKQACIDAVQEYIRNEKLDSSDDMNQYDGLSKEEFDKKMKEDLDKLGF